MPTSRKTWIARLLSGIAAIFWRPRQRQVAALVWRNALDGAGIEILTITTRRTKSWSIPKGWPMKKRSSAEAAATEAWEEAGIKGEIEDTSLGSYKYKKIPKKGGPPIRVEAIVFPLKAHSMEDEYPEAGQRERVWRSAEDAASVVREAGLRAIILSFAG